MREGRASLRQAARPQAARIDLQIDELVLEGIDPRDRHKIATALEKELERLLREQGILASISAGGTIDRIDGGSFELSARSKAEKLGRQVAGAVYGGLKR